MTDLTFVTGNAAKFHVGDSICQKYGIKLKQTSLDVPEIQSEDGEPVARDKAANAFQQLQTPLIISDDNWLIPGLNNFPGAYMKSINTWFTSEDWLRLTSSLEDRRIVLRLIVAYQDASVQKIFSSDIEGILLPDIKGTAKYTHTTVMSFNDGKTSLAEDIAAGHTSSDVPHSAWHQFAAWFNERKL